MNGRTYYECMDQSFEPHKGCERCTHDACKLLVASLIMQAKRKNGGEIHGGQDSISMGRGFEIECDEWIVFRR